MWLDGLVGFRFRDAYLVPLVSASLGTASWVAGGDWGRTGGAAGHLQPCDPSAVRCQEGQEQA